MKTLKSSEYIEKHFQPGDLIQLQNGQSFLTIERGPVSLNRGEIIMFLGKFECEKFGLKDRFLYQYLVKNQIVLDSWSAITHFEINCIVQLDYVRLE